MHRGLEFCYTPWPVPALYAALAIVLSFVLPRAEHRFFPELVLPMSVSVAATGYAAIASGMIALTGIVFSLTFVMVQFSATAYSPRLALWLVQDPFLTHALGVFVATFVYAIAALAWLGRDNMTRVPLISACLVISLLLASMGIFISLIKRIGTLQVNRILTVTGDQGREAITVLYPALQAHYQRPATGTVVQSRPSQTLIHSGKPRVIQAIKAGKLLQLATTHDCLIGLEVSVGDVVTELTPVLHIFGFQQKIDEQVLRDAIDFGENVPSLRIRSTLRLLVDIAIRAPSPRHKRPDNRNPSSG
jgi:uncharacterized membrane protein